MRIIFSAVIIVAMQVGNALADEKPNIVILVADHEDADSVGGAVPGRGHWDVLPGLRQCWYA